MLGAQIYLPYQEGEKIYEPRLMEFRKMSPPWRNSASCMTELYKVHYSCKPQDELWSSLLGKDEFSLSVSALHSYVKTCTKNIGPNLQPERTCGKRLLLRCGIRYEVSFQIPKIVYWSTVMEFLTDGWCNFGMGAPRTYSLLAISCPTSSCVTFSRISKPDCC